MNNRLQHFPIALFASVMGLTGLSLALGQTQRVLGLTLPVAELVALLAGALFVLLTGLYLAKLAAAPSALLADLNHPVRMGFAATFTVSLMLLAVPALAVAPALSALLWSAGALLHLALTVYALNAWVYQPRFEIQHVNPAWLIPVVGNIVAPLAGLHHAGPELSWFFFSIGLAFWLVLFVIIVYRLIFQPALPDKLLPTLFILIAPPAVGCLSYLKLTGELDAFARVLYYTALFLSLWLLLRAPRFLKQPFYLSMWACSFPLAAVTTASITMYGLTGEPLLRIVAYGLLFVLLAALTWLCVRTVYAARMGQILVEEP